MAAKRPDDIPEGQAPRPREDEPEIREARLRRADELQREMSARAQRAARDGADKISEALSAAAVGAGLKYAKPITEAIEDAGDFVASLFDSVFGGGDFDDDEPEPDEAPADRRGNGRKPRA
jgi:hypothetical protein